MTANAWLARDDDGRQTVFFSKPVYRRSWKQWVCGMGKNQDNFTPAPGMSLVDMRPHESIIPVKLTIERAE